MLRGARAGLPLHLKHAVSKVVKALPIGIPTPASSHVPSTARIGRRLQSSTNPRGRRVLFDMATMAISSRLVVLVFG